MSNLFEITGEDISKLGDADLRTLIGLLCEAECRSLNILTSGVTYGGNQDASDGGVDVVAKTSSALPDNNFLSSIYVGFQVKKPKMPPSQIKNEMRPKGQLREVIKDLIKNSGSYVIVSSGDSVSDSYYRDRIDAIREAVKSEKGAKNLTVDFFDQNRVATWVRSHQSLILWVRNRIDRNLRGWQPYDNWAHSPEGIEGVYLLDDELRLHDGHSRSNEGTPIEAGVKKLRNELVIEGKCVRLAGLSGVGKTRLVQSLFDSRLGDSALSPDLAFYTDMSDDRDIDPTSFAEHLIVIRQRAILIVDNCPPDLHRKLVKICSKANSTISLITVEYDVREDSLQETVVYRLEPASEELIIKLTKKRFPHIGDVDVRRIAEASMGNARVAIALSATVAKGESLVNLKDRELFTRLFQQREDKDNDLLASAEVLSLVYSFEGTDTESDKSEIKFLASLINKTASQLYRDIKTLKDRDLIQSRNVWRAILPHAIANNLATQALESIPKDKIADKFLESGSERLIKSFTRRLNFLHDSEVALSIANEWLSPNGWLGKGSGNFSVFGMDVLSNIAPLSPAKTLDAIERFVVNDSEFILENNPNLYKYAKLLRHVAYDAEFFERSFSLILKMALAQNPDDNHNSIREILESFFHLYLSGTHASLDLRVKILEKLLKNEDEKTQEIGAILLDASLEAWRFSSSFEFGFGALSRNYGYHPKTSEEITLWYEKFMDIGGKAALSNTVISEKVRNVIANNLRGLWTKALMFDGVQNILARIHADKPWNAGWLSVKKIIRFDLEKFDDALKARLQGLETSLRPSGLEEKIRTYILLPQNGHFDIGDDYDDEENPIQGWEKAALATRELGNQVANNQKILDPLLPEILVSQNPRVHNFGFGLAEGATNRGELWSYLHDKFKASPANKRQLLILQGFISFCSESDTQLCNKILDSSVNDAVLSQYYPAIQVFSKIDKRAVERLNESLDLGIADVFCFQNIACGRAHESINDDELAGLLDKIAKKEHGMSVAIEIINMRFYERSDPSKHSVVLLNTIREIIKSFNFSEARRGQRSCDYTLKEIIKTALVGEGGKLVAEKIISNFLDAISKGGLYSFDYPEFLNQLAAIQPYIFLDYTLDNVDVAELHHRRLFSSNFERDNNPLNQIPETALIKWCEESPKARYPLVCSAIQAFTLDDAPGTKWKDIVYTIFERAPELSQVLNNLADTIVPTSWSGSRASIIEGRKTLFSDLFEHENSEVRSWAKAQYTFTEENVRKEREYELSESRDLYESFE